MNIVIHKQNNQQEQEQKTPVIATAAAAVATTILYNVHMISSVVCRVGKNDSIHIIPTLWIQFFFSSSVVAQKLTTT